MVAPARSTVAVALSTTSISRSVARKLTDQPRPRSAHWRGSEWYCAARQPIAPADRLEQDCAFNLSFIALLHPHCHPTNSAWPGEHPKPLGAEARKFFSTVSQDDYDGRQASSAAQQFQIFRDLAVSFLQLFDPLDAVHDRGVITTRQSDARFREGSGWSAVLARYIAT